MWSASNHNIQVGGPGESNTETYENFSTQLFPKYCPITQLFSSMKSYSCSFAQFDQKWSMIARDLGMGSEFTEPLRRDIQLRIRSVEDAIYETVEHWVAREGSCATLGKFLDALERNGMNECGEFIRLQFNWPCRQATKNERILWKDLSPAFQRKVKESLICKFPTIQFGKNVLKSLEGNLLIDIMTRKEPELFKDNLPKELSYYVSRTLISRDVISSRIFELDTDDILLFTGMDWHELSQLVSRRITANSSTQIQTIYANYIILDRPSHFLKISRISSAPVHWLEMGVDGKLRWIKSVQSIQTIRRYIVSNDEEYIPEYLFVESLSNRRVSNSPVIIADSPGTGKSTFLAQMGRNLRIKDTEKVILFIEMSDLIKHVSQYNGLASRRNAIVTALQNLTRANDLEKIVLLSRMELGDDSDDKLSVELLLDGYDEVEPKYGILALEILQVFKNFYKGVRVWLTTRPHLLQQLELTLCTIGYNIQPFSGLDQIHFLSKFWSAKEETLNLGKSGAKLEQFAHHCLRDLNSRMCSRGDGIAGIPLQIAMIGEVYEEDAVEHAGLDEEFHSTYRFPVDSVTELYQKLIERKLSKHMSTFGAKYNEQSLLDMHARLALELMFPEYVGKLGKQLRQRETEAVLRVGLTERGNKSALKFIHKTFAEYFIAWLVVSRMETRRNCWNRLTCRNRSGWDNVCNEFLFQAVLRVNGSLLSDAVFVEFTHPVTCYFLNSLIPTAIHTHGMELSEWESLKPKELRRIAMICASQELVNLFDFLDASKAFSGPDSADVLGNQFLLDVIRYSGLGFVKMALTRFEKNHQFDEELKGVLIRVALSRGEFAVIEYLLKIKELQRMVRECTEDAWGAFHSCVRVSSDFNELFIAERVRMMRLLLNINASLIESKNLRNETPLLENGVHVHFMLKLLEWGANPLASDEKGSTILHLNSARQHLTPEEYHQLACAIPKQELSQLMHMVWEGKTPLVTLVEDIEPLEETLELFLHAGADFNFVTEDGWSVLGSSILSGKFLSREEDGLVMNGKGCSMKDVINALLSTENVFTLGEDVDRRVERLVLAARDLLPNTEIKTNTDQVFIQPLTEVLVTWVGREGRNATVNKFVNVLDCYGLGDVAEALRNAFMNGEHQTRNLLRRHVQTIQKLMELGADVNFADPNGLSILGLAILEECAEDVICTLIDCGADVNRENVFGVSIQEMAIQKGSSFAILEALTKSGARTGGDGFLGFQSSIPDSVQDAANDDVITEHEIIDVGESKPTIFYV